ncbi:MAG: biotin-dependent carboxyltransferase family protein [Thalassobaculales bacterium]
MTAALLARDPGPSTTLQDLGRTGWQRFGVPQSGAMDVAAHRAANALVGNPPGAATLEFTLLGGAWEVACDGARLAVAGGAFAVTIDGAPAAAWRSFTLRRGQVLAVGAARDAARGYIAVAGGFALAPVMGSLSTHVRSGIGGFRGRAIAAGDALPLARATPPEGPELALDPLPPRAGLARVVMGPQDDYFSEAAQAAFLAAPYAVTSQADRMGYRLAGPAVAHARGFNIISDAIALGSVQVPGTGQPIVLLADRQTTGGYPKIATVIAPDIRELAQARPGEEVRFAAVGQREALALHRAWAAALDGLPLRCRPVAGGDGLFAAERLLALTLIDGMVDARRPE